MKFFKNLFRELTARDVLSLAVVIVSLLALDHCMAQASMSLAVAATAISKLASWEGQGGRMEWWQFTLDPGSIAAAAQEIDTVAIPGARAGDPCWVEFEAPDANVITGGGKVTANDVVSVYLSNNITVTTATDSAAKVGNLLILKRTIPS
jgi:hypothetical protein